MSHLGLLQLCRIPDILIGINYYSGLINGKSCPRGRLLTDDGTTMKIYDSFIPKGYKIVYGLQRSRYGSVIGRGERRISEV